jgi:hypothetical protein
LPGGSERNAGTGTMGAMRKTARVHRKQFGPIACGHCRAEFMAAVATAKFCGRYCQSMAWKRARLKGTRPSFTNGGVRRSYRGMTDEQRAAARAEAHKIRKAEYYQRSREKWLARGKERRLANPEFFKRRDKIASKKWMLKDRTRYMDSYYGRRYGITHTHKLEMVEAQEGRCAICGDKITGKVCIDHCHATGTVRGILCYACNSGIGMLKDSIPNLFAAIEYLRRAAAVNASAGTGRKGKNPVCVHCETRTTRDSEPKPAARKRASSPAGSSDPRGEDGASRNLSLALGFQK